MKCGTLNRKSRKVTYYFVTLSLSDSATSLKVALSLHVCICCFVHHDVYYTFVGLHCTTWWGHKSVHAGQELHPVINFTDPVCLTDFTRSSKEINEECGKNSMFSEI